MNKMGIWNVRGINNPAKHSTIREMVVKHHLSILVMLETKIKEDNAMLAMSSCGLNMKLINNYEYAANGRIWLMWRVDEASIKLLYCSDQLIHVKVEYSNGGPHFLFTAAYV